MRVLDQVRGSYLSFRDLCAVRPVCKNWADLKSLGAHPHLIHFFDDGSLFDLPDSSDENFRKCLMNTTISIFHCQIFDNDDLRFVLKLLSSVKVLTMEIYGNEDDDNPDDRAALKWNPNTLSAAENVQNIKLEVSGFSGEIRIDFSALKKLNHFCTNVHVVFEKYDNRDMEHFGFVTDFMDGQYAEILRRTHTASMMMISTPSQKNLEYYDEWLKHRGKMKPFVTQVNMDSMVFGSISKDGLVFAPIFGIEGTQLSDFSNYFDGIFILIANMWPDIPVKFAKGCCDETKQLWLNLINPVRERIGLPPFQMLKLN